MYYLYRVLPAWVPAGQKRSPDLTIDGHEPQCGCWTFERTPVLLTSELSAVPQKVFIINELIGSCSVQRHYNKAVRNILKNYNTIINEETTSVEIFKATAYSLR